MLGQYLGHVAHRPVGGLHGIPIKGASEDVANREALVDDLQEGAGDVGLHLLGEGWVKPRDASFAAPSLVRALSRPGGVVYQLVRVASLSQRLLVGWSSRLEDGFTG